MKKKKQIWEIYALTDNTAFAKKLAEAKVNVIQYRDKEINDELFVERARAIKRICKTAKILFFINDRYWLNKKIKADGAHVGLQDDDLKKVKKFLSSDCLIGYSVKTTSQARRAEKFGVDYVSASPVFDSLNKTEEPGIGLKKLKAISRAVKIPTLAIGGINALNLKSVIKAGAVGTAFIGELANASNLNQKVKELKQIYKLCQIKK